LFDIRHSNRPLSPPVVIPANGPGADRFNVGGCGGA